eukprot:scpid94594/ scgid23924/ Casein kinase I isoform epsilon
MVKIISKVHEERIIHRDIKPDNFLIGGTETNKDTIFIIDFGLAKCYKNSDGEHIPYREGKNLTGTARYASIATHQGKEQSRRDDLETIGHVLLYFMLGTLPWQGLPGRTKNEKYANIKKKKIETPLSDLCRGLPSCFKSYMEHCRKLEFTQEPDYKYLTGLFETCMTENNFDQKLYDYTWKEDWLKRDKQSLKEEIQRAILGGKKKKEETKGGDAH